MGAVLRITEGDGYDERVESTVGEVLESVMSVCKGVVISVMDKFRGKGLQELSEVIREEGKKITSALLEGALRASSEESEGCAPCPQCGRVHASKRMTSRKIETIHGEQEVRRRYFHCRECEIGYVPFDEAMELAPQKKQYDLQKGAAILLSRLPFEEASQVFKELTGNTLSDHAMHDIACRIGEEADIKTVLPSADLISEKIDEYSRGCGWRPILVVSADGAHAPTRPETGSRAGQRGPGSWQEAKGFRMYLVGQDRIEQVLSWHQIGTEKEFGDALTFAATLIPKDRVRIALVADGAQWIWNHFTTTFPDGRQILDYYHCSEHVHKVASLLYSNDEEKRAGWIETTMARLFCGEVDSVIWGLQRVSAPNPSAKKEVDLLVSYLKKNAKRIDYQRNRRGQYPCGSGAIESANKFICHKRMKVSGAWWYKINGNKMLKLRCSLFNATFDEVFRKYKRAQRRGAVRCKKIGTNA